MRSSTQACVAGLGLAGRQVPDGYRDMKMFLALVQQPGLGIIGEVPPSSSLHATAWALMLSSPLPPSLPPSLLPCCQSASL